MPYTLSLGQSPLGTPLAWQGGNGHIAILGQSGQGKSVFLRHLIGQLPDQGIRCIVFDCAGDFRADALLPEHAAVKEVRRMLPPCPFRPLYVTPSYQETAGDTAARICGSILDAYAFRGSAQPVRLRSAVTEFVKACGSDSGFDALIQWIQSDKSRAARLEPSLIRLQDLAQLWSGSDAESHWDLDIPGITVLQFDTVPDQAAQRVLTELLLSVLWSEKLASAGTCPLVVVLDECQRFSFQEGSMLPRILREGRKFGIHGWFASQWISRKPAALALEQAALRVWFFPGEDHIRSLAKSLSANAAQSERCLRLIRSLRVGRCLYRHSNGSLCTVCVPPSPDTGKPLC